MTMNDDELRQRFHELREQERVLTPRFRAEQRRVLWPRFAFAALLVLIVTTSVRVPHEEDFAPADRLAAQSIAAWHAPTDALLQTPGRELLSDLPDIPSADLPKGALP